VEGTHGLCFAKIGISPLNRTLSPQFYSFLLRVPAQETAMRKNNLSSISCGILTLLGVVAFKTSALGQG
jgi:hypothetical protein